MPRMKMCSCGKVIPERERCSCKIEGDRARNNKKNKRYKEEKKFFNSGDWKNLRERILKRDNEVCIRCLIKYNVVVKEKLEVHHIKPRIDYPELRFNEDNLITLCKLCNTHLGTRGELDFKWEIPTEGLNEPVL